MTASTNAASKLNRALMNVEATSFPKNAYATLIKINVALKDDDVMDVLRAVKMSYDPLIVERLAIVRDALKKGRARMTQNDVKNTILEARKIRRTLGKSSIRAYQSKVVGPKGRQRTKDDVVKGRQTKAGSDIVKRRKGGRMYRK